MKRRHEVCYNYLRDSLVSCSTETQGEVETDAMVLDRAEANGPMESHLICSDSGT